MNQTSKIAAALIIAWAIFITWRGELPVYMGILGIGAAADNLGTCGAGYSIGSALGSAGSSLLGNFLGASTNLPSLPSLGGAGPL